jgi:hypothetical protein
MNIRYLSWHTGGARRIERSPAWRKEDGRSHARRDRVRACQKKDGFGAWEIVAFSNLARVQKIAIF